MCPSKTGPQSETEGPDTAGVINPPNKKTQEKTATLSEQQNAQNIHLAESNSEGSPVTCAQSSHLIN